MSAAATPQSSRKGKSNDTQDSTSSDASGSTKLKSKTPVAKRKPKKAVAAGNDGADDTPEAAGTSAIGTDSGEMSASATMRRRRREEDVGGYESVAGDEAVDKGRGRQEEEGGGMAKSRHSLDKEPILYGEWQLGVCSCLRICILVCVVLVFHFFISNIGCYNPQNH